MTFLNKKRIALSMVPTPKWVVYLILLELILSIHLIMIETIAVFDLKYYV